MKKYQIDDIIWVPPEISTRKRSTYDNQFYLPQAILSKAKITGYNVKESGESKLFVDKREYIAMVMFLENSLSTRASLRELLEVT